MKTGLGAVLVFVMTFLVLAAVACESTPASPGPTEPGDTVYRHGHGHCDVARADSAGARCGGRGQADRHLAGGCPGRYRRGARYRESRAGPIAFETWGLRRPTPAALAIYAWSRQAYRWAPPSRSGEEVHRKGQ